MNLLLYGNGGSGNHGCEAIVRGTVALMSNANYTIQSDSVEEDTCYSLDQLATLRSATAPLRRNFQFFTAYLQMKLLKKYVAMDGLTYLPGVKAVAGDTDVALSIGGDNYCYEGTQIYPYLNRAYRKAGVKTALWGCSVEPSVLKNTSVAADLASYSLIVARESITSEALKTVQKNVVLAPDPAFFMDSTPCALDPRLESGNVIGVNASPMIISNEKVSGMAYENYKRLISHILDTTDAVVALIPHVVWARNDDRTVLKKLYHEFNENERLVLVEDHTAPELKYIISKCQFFIGARTHSTIAAYSTCVPTLVVGYSVKARGIARDLFGTEKDYVLPVQDLKEQDDLTQAFDPLYQKRDEIHNHLSAFLPDYKAKGQDAVRAVEALSKSETK